MKNYNVGSALKQSDYSKQSQLGLIAACGIAALVLVVAFFVPLLG